MAKEIVMDEEYLDINLIDPEKITKYEKYVPDKECDDELHLYRKICLVTADQNNYHKYCGFNKFSKETYPIPSKEDGWMDLHEIITEDYNNDSRQDSTFEKFISDSLRHYHEWIKDRVCDPTAKIFDPNTEPIIKNDKSCQMYKTLDNYSVGFVVIINQNTVYIYGRTRDVIADRDLDELVMSLQTEILIATI